MSDTAILSLGPSGLRIDPMPEVRAPDFECFVPGIPRPQGSKSPTRNGGMRESSKYVAAWRRTVKLAAEQAMREARQRRGGAGHTMPGAVPLDGPLVLGVEFVFSRPKKHERRCTRCRKAIAIDCHVCHGMGHLLRVDAPVYVTSKPDTGKCLRAIEDSLTDAQVWGDDSQVVGYAGFPLTCKRYANPGEEPGARIRVWRVECQP